MGFGEYFFAEQEPKLLTVRSHLCGGYSNTSLSSGYNGSLMQSSAGTRTSDISNRTNLRTEVHYINSAIFIEKLESDNDELDSVSQIGSIAPHSNIFADHFSIPKLELSTTSLLSTDTSNIRRSHAGSYDEWLSLKEKEKQLRINKENQQREMQEAEKLKKFQMEKENFKKWLAAKKEKEKQMKLQLELEQKKLKLLEEIRIKKNEQNKQAFLKWYKMKKNEAEEKKKKEDQEKHLQVQLKKLREQKSHHAFEDWLEKSKFNPRPVPLNMGVKSLRGSASAMFINPNPWHQDIELS